jgi:hypothetical protein
MINPESKAGNFMGTNIPETLQKIVSDEMLERISPTKQLIRRISGRTILLNYLPPSIDSDDKTISLRFNKQCYSSDPYTDIDFPSGKQIITSDSLVITYRDENQFSLSVTRRKPKDLGSYQQGKPKFGNGPQIIEQITKFIARETGHKLNP